MEGLYEVVIGGEDERLVLRESERPAHRGSARLECRRALRLPNQARELIACANALRLDLTQARSA